MDLPRKSKPLQIAGLHIVTFPFPDELQTANLCINELAICSLLDKDGNLGMERRLLYYGLGSESKVEEAHQSKGMLRRTKELADPEWWYRANDIGGQQMRAVQCAAQQLAHPVDQVKPIVGYMY